VSAPSPKVLLVDDIEENLVALEAIFRERDIPTVRAQGGRAALEVLLVQEFAVALVDVQMPDMDGFELAELMRGSARTRQVPIIFITAGGSDAHRVFAGYEAGAVDFLFKPVDERVLLSKCAVFLELYRQRVELQEQLRLNELLMAAVGHDLRNPLDAMLMAGQLLDRMCEAPDQRKVLDRMRSSGRHMTRLIDDLFDTARIRLDKGLTLDRRPGTDLKAIAEAVVSEQSTGISSRERPIVIRALGDTSGPWDHDRLLRVLSNLVGNAIRHGKRATPIVIELDGTHPARVTCSVVNEGEIAADVLPDLWEPFRRARTTSSGHARGLGLGLYIARQITQAHGGRLDARAGEGKTTFELSLPR
jgi:signal transduction histidine kinase